MPFGEDPRELLTSEELRELLSPIDVSEDDNGELDSEAILLLTERPEDVEVISVFMTPYEVRVVPTNERYRALDLFRRRRYRAFVSTPASWGDDAPNYLERLHAVDPGARLVFICDAHELPTIPRSERVDRPLTPQSLQSLLAPSGITVGDSYELAAADAPSATPPAESAARALAEPMPPEPMPPEPIPPEPSSPEPVASEPLAGDASLNVGRAAEALLASHLDGTGLVEGMKKWAELDAGIHGLLIRDARAAADEWDVRIWAPHARHRRTILAESASLLEELDGDDRTLRLTGVFLIIPLPAVATRSRSVVALRLAAPSPEAVARVEPVIELMLRLSAREAPEAVEALEEILRLRIALAADRVRSSLGLWILPQHPKAAEVLRQQLRQDDWFTSREGHFHVVVDTADRQTLESLHRRFSAAVGDTDGSPPGSLGLLLRPGEDAAELLRRARQALSETLSASGLRIVD